MARRIHYLHATDRAQAAEKKKSAKSAKKTLIGGGLKVASCGFMLISPHVAPQASDKDIQDDDDYAQDAYGDDDFM